MTSQLGLSSDLTERGHGLMFRVSNGEKIYPAFAIRYEGIARACLNDCAHVGLRLNRDSNILFNQNGNLLQCMSHGAVYAPDSGLCTWGPCEGMNLIGLTVVEQDEKYNLVDD